MIEKSTLPLVYFFLIFTFFVLFVSSLGKISHDEDMYLLGARFSQDHSIYGDFLYLQPPLHAFLLGRIFKFLPSDYYFLTSRIVNFFFAAGIVILTYALLRSVVGRLPSLVFSSVIVMNLNFYYAAGVSRNDLMPLFLTLFAVFLMLQPGRSKWENYAAAGLCLSLAVGTKLNYAHVPLVAVFFSALWPPGMAIRWRLLKQVVPLVLGGLTGLFLIISLAMADFYVFYYGAVGHRLDIPPEYLELRRSLYSFNRTILLAVNQATSFPVFTLVVLFPILFTYVLLKRNFRGFGCYLVETGQWLFWLLFISSVPLTLMIMPSWEWYYLPPITFFILSFASLWSFVKSEGKELSYGVPLVVFLSCIPNFVEVTSATYLRLAKPQKWLPVTVAMASHTVDTILDSASVHGKIATLSPSRLINTRREFYLELATGWSFYRRAAFLPPEQVRRVHGVSPNTLSTVFAADMPAAIFGGYEERWDKSLFNFAEANGYERIVDPSLGDGILYVRRSTRQ